MVWSAVLYSLRRPPMLPLAALRTLRRRARPGTTVFARVMTNDLLPAGGGGSAPSGSMGRCGDGLALAEQARHARLIRIGHHHGADQPALARAGLADHAVADAGSAARRESAAGEL